MAEALAKGLWTAAVVATPAHTHVEIGRVLTGAGIPVMLEKPVAVTTAGLGAWRMDLRRQPVPVAVGYVLRFHPALVAVRKRVLAGAIGEPHHLIARRGAYLPARRPDYARGYYKRPEQGGGVVHDILSHVFNAAEWLVGPSTRLTADAAHLSLPGVSVDDTVHVLARHGSVLASYVVSQHRLIPESVIEVHGSRGCLRVDFVAGTWASAQRPEGSWRVHAARARLADCFVAQAKEFLAAAGGRRGVRCELDEGIGTLRAVRATLSALRVPGWRSVAA